MDEGLFPVSFNGGVIAPGIWVVPNNSLGIRVTAPAVSFGNCAQMADSTAVQTSGVNIAIGLTVAACATALGPVFAIGCWFLSNRAAIIALILRLGGYGRSTVPVPGRVFDCAATNCAGALDHPGIVAIAVGMWADLAMIDLGAPAMNPRISAISCLVHFRHPGMVTDTIAKAHDATLSMWRKSGAEDRGVPLPHHDLA